MKKGIALISAAAVALMLTTPSAADTRMEQKIAGKPAVASQKAGPAVKRGAFSRATVCPGGAMPSLRRAMTAAHVYDKTAPRVQTSWPDLRGAVVNSSAWSSADKAPGLYKINSDGTVTADLLGPSDGYGVAVDGYFYSCALDEVWGMYLATVKPYNLSTGAVGTTYSIDPTEVPVDAAVDPTDGTVYGICYTEDVDGLTLSKLTYGQRSASSQVVAQLFGDWCALACTAQGQLYGIKRNMFDGNVESSMLYKLDKETGAYTYIGETGQLPHYLSSATIDPKSGRMFWSVSQADQSGLLCEVDLATGVATVLTPMAHNEEIVGMYVAEAQTQAEAPAVATMLNANFPRGGLTGAFEFKAPSTLHNGEAASGAVDYTVTVDDAVAATGSTSYGSIVSCPLTLAASGMHTFNVTMKNLAGEGPVAKLTAYVGMGEPAMDAPALTYSDGVMTLKWQAATETTSGGFIDPAAVTYTVTRYPDEVVVAERIAQTFFSEPVAEPDAIVNYYYTVQAHNGDAVSQPAASNYVALGAIVPPYSNDFATSSALSGFTIIDGNDDGKQWNVVSGRLRMDYNSNVNMDDWLITPAMKLTAGTTYKVSFAVDNNYYDERIEAKWGTAPTAEAMTLTLVPPTDVTGPAVLSGEIKPDATGTYYIGIHGISDADCYYLYVDDLEISAGTAADAPAAPTDAKVTIDPDGALKADISFKAPLEAMSGAALAALTKVELSRGSELIKTFDAPAPGALLSHTDVVDAAGEYTYTIVAYNADGAGTPATVSAFIGPAAPAAPADVVMTETANEGEVTITWTAVSSDEHGSAINPALVTYKIAAFDSEGSLVPVTGTITGTSYTFRAVPQGEQDFVQYAVAAYTPGGNNATPTAMMPVGTPYAGMKESFPDGSLNYAWAIGYALGGQWNTYDDSFGYTSADGDNGYVGMRGYSTGHYGSLISGKISLVGMTDPGLSFYTLNIADSETHALDDRNEIQVFIREAGAADWLELGAPVVVNTLSDKEGWALYATKLTQYAGKVIELRFQATTKTCVYTLMDVIRVGQLSGYDLIADGITAPASVKAGEDYTVSVTVANDGTNDSGEFTVELYADGEKADTRTVQSLPSGQKTALTFARTMSPVATDAVSYHAVVVLPADEEPSNNTTETVGVAPVHSSLPAVTDLKAETAGSGAHLTWSEPDLSAASLVTDIDFEDAQSWAQEYAGWIFVDVDDSPIGGFQNVDLPGLTVGVSKASFFVFDSSANTFNLTFNAHSGNKTLAALYRSDDGTTDDWAISPELSGAAQTITFWARSYAEDYPEKIEMYYSTGSLTPSDFVLVKKVDQVPGGLNSDKTDALWTQYSFEVPAGATRFAIRSCATGSFMLQLDDFCFEPALVPLSIVGYDVYRDGVKLTAEPTGEMEYTDTEAPEGMHSYVVVAVYESGSSAPSNAASVATSGISDAVAAGGVAIAASDGHITVAGAEGLHVAIAAADGRLIYAGQAGTALLRVAVAPGVYAVKAGDTVAKVAVR